jgi:hypothetical protein
MGLHGTLLGLLRFTRNDIFNQIGASTGSQFRSTAAIIQPIRKLGAAAGRMADRRRRRRDADQANLAHAFDAEQPSACAVNSSVPRRFHPFLLQRGN